MAFGFPAYHTEEAKGFATDIPLRESVKDAIRSLGWSIRDDSTKTITASTSLSLWSWGEKVTIRFLPGNGLSVTSQCALFTQCIDWGKNKTNVHKLLAEIRKQGQRKQGQRE